MTAQPALEGEQVEHILHRPVVLLHAEVGVVLVVLAVLVEAAFLAGQMHKLAHNIVVRRDGVLHAFIVHHLAADVGAVEYFLVAEADVLAVVVKGKVHALRLFQRLRKDAHAQPAAAVEVLDGSRAEQCKPGRRTLYRNAFHRAFRGLLDRRKHRCAGYGVGDAEPFIADGALLFVAGVGL